MYGYNLTVLLLLCCLLIVDVTGRCPCRHRKRHRKCGSGSSDTHSSESSSESSEQHTKRTPNSTSNTTTVASTTTTTTQAPLATGSTGAPASVPTAAQPTTGPPALSTRATAAPPTGPTIAPSITGAPAASPSTRTTAASSGTVSTAESTKTTSTTTQKITTTTTLPGGPTTTFVRPTCCPSGWIRFNATNSCYLVQNNANWSDAEQICVSKNAHLVSLHSDDEENFVLNLTRTGQSSSNVTSGIWIGLKAIVTGKSYEWTDGSPVDYTKWVVGSEPDGIGQYGRRYPANCVNIRIDWSYAWDDDNCWAVMRAFVCKQPVQNC